MSLLEDQSTPTPTAVQVETERIERIAAWLEGLCTATYGFRDKAKHKWLREAAKTLRELRSENIRLKGG